MRLNHLNLTVPDVAETRAFFETHFDMKCVVERGRNAFALLLDESGFVLSLNNFGNEKTIEYPEAFHVGFMVESRERVDEIRKRLEDAGLDVEPAKEFHGAWTFYFKAPGGFLVEVLHQHKGNFGPQP
ncbi:VOC family protein [Singulisphaera sp. PoT]|uniref:VOC family protein n=1 Tax=Singulisphaera sp. PoT TaxID=3411797 RepID=UPI003BF5A7CE